MKKIICGCFILLLTYSCKETVKTTEDTTMHTDSLTNQVQEVTSFTGQQLTGVTVSGAGRIFVNFPRWRKGVENSVMEIGNEDKKTPYPNKEWNSWEIGSPAENQKFVGVQSVVAFEDKLYVLDTRSPLFGAVLDAPRIFVFNLNDNTLAKTYILDEGSYYSNSYINDLRVDKNNNKIYCTDSGRAGLIIIDINSGKTTRVLDNHISTKAEQAFLTFGDKKWENTIHSDGIALDSKNGILYYHALTGYSLYSVPTNIIATENQKDIEAAVKLVAKTAAPDGMIIDDQGTLYFADLENNKIMSRTIDGNIKTLVEGEKVKWADTFSFYNGYLYYTNSRINEVSSDISKMTFTLNKVKI
ncbi:hypothetical protein H8R23_00100 [Flavobacterium sp. F-380]|uniref:Major royal jelly protein n=1 Tax=Flavobacterium kayseriense TaxID=2764714 RepID=A0ABR7J2M3_9FLAO|nr:L-dopachrome tautomerase-related protein [Flavobacterium kayseriense]MBC5839801.1 hypothetical protein [Flavobacterium kayseriense]MBC5847529.1 hypothetical protein [Flavobacterium kayseriense]